MMKKYILSLVLAIIIIFTGSYCLAETSTTELSKLLEEGRFQEIILKARKELRRQPDNPEINLRLGQALTERLQFTEAIPYLEKANHQNDYLWIKGWALDYLGRCYFATNALDESRADFKECLELKATPNGLNDATYYDNLFGFSERFAKWSTIPSEHFIFHFEQPSKVQDTAAFIRDYENAFTKIAPFFQAKIPRKIQYFIWNSDELMRFFHSPGGFTNSEYCIIHARYFQSAGHEMTQVFSYYIHPFPVRVGLINEGVAVYFDQTGTDQLKLARWLLAEHDVHQVSIRELWNQWNQLPEEESYPVAGSFVKYLMEHGGEQKFKRLLADQSIENARRIYGSRLDRFIKDFEKLLSSPNEVVKIDALKLTKAYWSNDPQMQNLGMADDPRCFFVELEMPRSDILPDQLGGFPKDIPQEYRTFILTADGKLPIAVNTDTMKMTLNNQSYWYIQFEISNDDFNKMEPGIEYRLAAVKADPKNRIRISPEVKLTRSVSEK